MTTVEQTFEDAVAEYIARSREQLGQEIMENLPPKAPAPFDTFGPPYEAALRLDFATVRNYALSIGDNNPLYTDPDYGKRTRYGCQIAPGPVLAQVRYPTGHGARRPQGYPVANFYSGTAWEFYDAIRVGSKFRSTKVASELIEREGSKGKLLFLITELCFWDYHGDLVGKGYSTQIQVPTASMGGSRSMSVERLGERMMYERGATKYSPEQVRDLVEKLGSQKRRGASTLYWEDVQVGEKLGPMALPPWTLQDQIAFHFLALAASAEEGESGDEYGFELAYHQVRRKPGRARTHPNTRWPWTIGNEHEDALLAPYRTQPLPFDFGTQRCQIPQKLITDWMGDDGFIRRLYLGLRRPVYYGDATIYTGEVVKKFKEVQQGDTKPGGIPGKTEYNAVGIRIDGNNQLGEAQAPGTATVYLPSRAGGAVQLAVPHPARPAYVNYDTYRRDWY